LFFQFSKLARAANFSRKKQNIFEGAVLKQIESGKKEGSKSRKQNGIIEKRRFHGHSANKLRRGLQESHRLPKAKKNFRGLLVFT
jgi:hypothetical protein